MEQAIDKKSLWLKTTSILFVIGWLIVAGGPFL